MDVILNFLQGTDMYVLIPALAFFVFLVVKLLAHFGFLKSGDYQRIGVLIGSIVTTGMLDDLESQVSAIFVGVLAVLFNELSAWLYSKVKN